MQVHIIGGSLLGLGLFSFRLCFLGVMGGFFVGEPLLASILPLL